jgi:hypothetical protein
MRSRESFGGFTPSEVVSEDFPAAGERSERWATLSSSKPLLIVVLPDGTTVTARVAGQL